MLQPQALDLLQDLSVLVLQLCNELSDRKSTRLNSSHTVISYAVFCLKKKKTYSCCRSITRPVIGSRIFCPAHHLKTWSTLPATTATTGGIRLRDLSTSLSAVTPQQIL